MSNDEWTNYRGIQAREQDIEHLKKMPVLIEYLARVAGRDDTDVRATNFRTFKVLSRSSRGDGYARPLATIRLKPEGLECPGEEFAPTAEEADKIKAELVEHLDKLPRSHHAKNTTELVRMLEPKFGKPILYECRSADGEKILFVQQRADDLERGKYLPWTFFNDGEWRMMEPDGPLPLYGLDDVRDHGTILIHEGARKAHWCQAMRDGVDAEAKAAFSKLPDSFAAIIRKAAHVAWCSGAGDPARSDWDALRKALQGRRVIVVADNDDPGIDAVPRVSYLLGCPMEYVRFDNRFPVGFDLADPFPETLWDERQRYIGPHFDHLLHPATYAIALRDDSFDLRPEFINEWWAVTKPRSFIHRRHLWRRYDESEFNNAMSPFAGGRKIAALMLNRLSAKADGVEYDPRGNKGLIATAEGSKVNLYTPSNIKPIKDDPAPFIHFLSHLIPDAQERHYVMKWIASLIVVRHVRVHHGVLLISETQGVGKTTLGEKIIAPLVGWHNTGFPSEAQFTGSWTSWVAFKTFVLVNELYVGKKQYVYDRVKGAITDKEIDIEEKYEKTYRVHNWIRVLACSNTLDALYMAHGDTRWFVPRVTEEAQPHDYWVGFNDWLKRDGLGIILQYLSDFVSEHGHFEDGVRAQWTPKKEEMIANSRSGDANRLHELAHKAAELGRPGYQVAFVDPVTGIEILDDEPASKLRKGIAYKMKPIVVRPPEKIVLFVDDVGNWLAEKRAERNYNEKVTIDRPATIAKHLRDAGLFEPPAKGKNLGVKVHGRWMRVVANFPLGREATWATLREFVRKPRDFDPRGL